jgi:hypothetical protein
VELKTLNPQIVHPFATNYEAQADLAFGAEFLQVLHSCEGVGCNPDDSRVG